MKIWLKEVMDELNVDRQTAQGLMTFLVGKGLVEKIGYQAHPHDPPGKKGRPPVCYEFTPTSVEDIVGVIEELGNMQEPTAENAPSVDTATTQQEAQASEKTAPEPESEPVPAGHSVEEETAPVSTLPEDDEDSEPDETIESAVHEFLGEFPEKFSANSSDEAENELEDGWVEDYDGSVYHDACGASECVCDADSVDNLFEA